MKTVKTTKSLKGALEFTEEQFQELDRWIREYKGKSGAVIRTLYKAQEIFGCLPREVQNRIAKGLQIPLSKVYGIVTFYSFFSIEPKGKHKIHSCQGTACYVRGSKEVLNALRKTLNVEVGGTTEDREFTLESIRCVGACALAPLVRVDDEIYQRVSPKKIKNILREHTNKIEG